LQVDAIRRITNMSLKNPLIIGFGIRNRADYAEACKLGSGAIIGSAFINVIAGSSNLQQDISQFIDGIKKL
jgi:tryptophan synthase alpha chain